jgi:hypothetical protein
MSVALGIGAISFIAGTLGKHQENKAKYRANKAAIRRSNTLARQRFENQLKLNIRTDEEKGRVFEAELDAAALSRTALAKQIELNQISLDRASVANQLNLEDKFVEAAFQDQKNLAESIRAQGTLAASGVQPGQSMEMAMGDIERQLGFEESAVEAALLGEKQGFGLAEYGLKLDKYSADNQAINQLPTGPTFGPGNEFPAVPPLYQSDPEKPSLLNAALSGLAQGAQAYASARKA